jgi:hypothetical protein
MRSPNGLLPRLMNQRRRQEARMARTARKRMGSEERPSYSREREWTRDYGGVDAGDGFAPLRVVGICVLWALAHSVLASKQAKDLARRFAGPRYRDGLYRFAFNAQSVVSLLWAALRFSRLPLPIASGNGQTTGLDCGQDFLFGCGHPHLLKPPTRNVRASLQRRARSSAAELTRAAPRLARSSLQQHQGCEKQSERRPG